MYSVIKRILSRFYSILGLFLVAVGLFLLTWGELKESPPPLSGTRTVEESIQSFESFESSVEFKLENLSDVFIFHKRFGNFELLINELNKTEQAKIKATVDNAKQRDDIPIEVYSLTVNDKIITTFEDSTKVIDLWLKSVQTLAFYFVFLGSIGILFGDRLVRKVRSDW